MNIQDDESGKRFLFLVFVSKSKVVIFLTFALWSLYNAI